MSTKRSKRWLRHQCPRLNHGQRRHQFRATPLAPGWRLVSQCAVLLAALLSLVYQSTVAAPQPALSQQAQGEIRALLEEKASWTGAQRKMESHLTQALKRHRGQAFAPGAPNLKLDLKKESDGRILVDIRANVTEALLAQIKQEGGTVIGSYPRFHAIRALVKLDQLETLAGSAEVRFIRRAARAMTNIGSVTSEGDVTHRADLARSGFGVNGQGVKIGVLSDSIDYLADAQLTGDLGDVTVLPGQGGLGGSGEGTAMLEIVHDLAPGAQLYFATAYNSEASFAQNILDLRSNGCDVIIDDVYYFDESPFQDAIIAQAVNSVTASGALYFSAAGNDGNAKDGTSGTWEGDFMDAGQAGPPVNIGGGRLHSFGDATYNTVVSGGYGVQLFWADPLGASTNDYDLFLLDSTGTYVVASSLNAQTGTQDPYEELEVTPEPGQRLVIVKSSGASRFLHLVTSRGRLNTQTTGAIRGHAAAAAAYGVAAVDVATAFPLPFSGGGANPVETFSSDGPRHVFYNPDGSPITPGNYSSTGGAVRQKPDLAAADGVATSLYYFNPFYGTSAAAPHAGAIAALLLSYDHTLTPSQVRNALTSTALDIEDLGPDPDSGAGIVMAYGALQSLAPRPVITAGGSAFVAEGCLNGVLDPGETVKVALTLTNLGPADTTNLVATLLSSGGVTSPSGPQSYGVLTAHGGTTNRVFSFTASGTCGGTNVATLQLQDGPRNLGTVSFPFPLGKTRVSLAESFDAVTPPALPPGWSVSSSGAGAPWSTTSSLSDTPPNSVFAPDAYGTSDNSLLSPVMTITTAFAQLSFRHSFSTYYYYYDGGVLEISTNGGAFTDILAAGGSFVKNGYYSALYTGYGNPLGGRQAWSGYSGGFITTIVNLPASTAGQNVQLRWRFGTSSYYGGGGNWGWYIDTVSLTDGFDCCVPVANDISVGISAAPEPAVLGATLTYTITVVNTGPATANNVTVTDVLPPSFTLQSLGFSPPAGLSGRGTSGPTLTFNVGTMPGGSSANITIVGIPGSAGFITNRVTVTRSEPDANLGNNTATAVSTVTLPLLSIADVSLFDGASGTTNALFVVSLSQPVAQTVTVNFATSDQTAQAGRDYVATSGTLIFAPGVTRQTIPVAVIGSTLNKPNLTFLVTLSNPSNAVLTKAQAIGTILNDDPLPNLSVSDATVNQPDSGTTNAVFTVSLSTPSGRSVSAYYYTSNGTASASTDYLPVYSTLLTFNPGETNKIVTVVVENHLTARPAQTFYLALENSSNAKIARGAGLGTIITARPGQADHFTWSVIPSPQTVGGPVAVTITAQDYWNNPATNFNGSVGLSAWTNTGSGSSGSVIEDFESGIWPQAPWVPVFSPYGTVSPAYAHDGVYGLTDPEWTYRTDVQLGSAGDSLSWWVRPSTAYNGRAYLGFGASAAGAWSVVAAPNTGEFTIQQNAYYNYVDVVTTSQAWQAGKWYKVVVQFLTSSSVVCNLYDSDGATLLNSLSYNGVTGLPGGVAIRSFDGFSLDTIVAGGAGSPGGKLALAPANSGSFTAGVWQGNVAVGQPATNVTLRADDGHGHTGSSNPFDVQPLAGQITSFAWNPVPSPQTSGAPFSVTIIAQDYFRTAVTNFNGAVALTGSGLGAFTTNTILPSPAYLYSSSGAFTLGYAFTPNTNITLTAVRSYFGTKVSIWTDGGVLLASQNVSGTPGTWVETPLTTPIQLTAGTRYRVAAYTGGGNYYYRTDLGNTFPNGTINQSYEVSGDAFPANADYDQWWFVDLKYTVATPVPVSVSPPISANFTNGVWRGSVAVGRGASSVVLAAGDALGHSGSSNPFDVTPGRGQIDHLVWSPVGSPQAVGEPFGVTVTAQDYFNSTATNFNGTVALSGVGGGGITTNTILPSPLYQYYSSGYYTLGYAFTPNTNLTVTHVRSYFGSKVSIWTDGGVLLASQIVNTTPGTWVETPLATPIQLTAGTRYRVAAYTAGGYYYYRTDMGATFPNGTIDQSYEVYGDAFPVGTDSDRWWFVDLRYTTGSVVPVPIAPSLSGNFTNGVWSGSVNVLQGAANVVLRADDGSGHNGSSNPFNVAPRGQLDHFVWGPISSPQSSGVPFGVTITAQDFFNNRATNFSGPASLSAAGSKPATNTILPSPSYTYSSSGDFTLGYAFTPNTNMTVTHVRSYYGTKVSIWTDSGVLLASRSVTSVPGTWVETPLITPIQLTAGTRYRVAAYTGGGNYYYRYDLGFTFPNGTINQSYEANGDAFPAVTDTEQWWFVDLKYAVAAPVPVALSQASSGNFTNGSWSGSLTALPSQPIGNVVLKADDGSGHTGLSNPFNVMPPAGQIDHLVWSPVGSPQAVGEPFGVTITAQDYYNSTATNFNGTVALSGVGGGGTTTNTILPSPFYQYYYSGYYTLGYSFTPNTNLTLTHVRSYFGTKVSIWTDGGVLLASQNVSSAPGTWVETPLATPIQLTAGTRYRVAAYTAGGNYYYRTDLGATFPNGTIDQSYEVYGDAFPVGTDSDRWWFVDLRYTTGSVVPVPITPSLSGNFANGVWSGSVSVLQGPANVALLADDGSGHKGSSNPFNVAPRGQLDHFAWGPISSPQSPTTPFGVTISAQDFFNNTATNFSGPAALSAAGSMPVTNTILPSPSYLYYSSGTYTLGYAFTPNTNLTVTHVRSYFGTKVSIWTDSGVLLASRSVTSVPGTWVETPLITPIQLTAGTRYRVAAYTGGGNYYYRTDLASTFPNGTINQSYEASGDAFPSLSDSYYWMFVDLKYTVATPVPVALSAPSSGNFTNGNWSGSLTVLAVSQPVSNVVLKADDGSGHTGLSSPFAVAPAVGQIDHIAWSHIGSPQTNGTPFAVTLTALDYYNGTATNFSGAVALSGSWPGSLTTNTILPSPSYQYYYSGYYTLGYAFTPNTNLTVTHVRSYFGSKVSIWTDGGVLLASQNVNSVPGTWVETPLATPIQLTAGTRYRVAAYTAGGNYYYRTDLGATFPNGIINQSYEASGDAFPSSIDNDQWWFVDLKYTVSAPIPALVTPSASGNFTNGIWSGRLTVLQLATNLVMRADDSSGHTAYSNPFNVIPLPQPPLIVLPPASRVVFVGGLASFSVAATGTAPLSYQWRKDGLPIAGATDSTCWIPSAQSIHAGRYSVIVSNRFGSASASNATLTVVSSGNVVAWGDNSTGQTNPPPGLGSVVAVAGGYGHSLALRNDGTVAAWGDNSVGQTNVPSGLNNVVAIAGGYYHNLALRTDGTIAAWGDNSDGQTNVPAGLNNILAIACGGFHSLALRNDGTVLGWGYNGYGQTTPPAGLNNVVAIAGGAFDSLALRKDGTVVAWGYNADGETNVPVGVTAFVAAASGRFHNLAAGRDGTVAAWGYNGSGQATVPPGLSNVVAVAGGGDHSLALSRDGTVAAWGYNLYGQCDVPTNLTNVAAIASGYSHSLALVANDPPKLLTQPLNLTVVYGASAAFGATYRGAVPFGFQWQKNGTNLAGASADTLQLLGVTRADEANYRLIITNLFGSMTSSNALLRVLVPQQFKLASRDASGAFHLWFADALGGGLANPANIQVLAATNLLPSNSAWTVLTNGTAVVTNGLLRFDDPNAAKFPQRFYRIIEH